MGIAVKWVIRAQGHEFLDVFGTSLACIRLIDGRNLKYRDTSHFSSAPTFAVLWAANVDAIVEAAKRTRVVAGTPGTRLGLGHLLCALPVDAVPEGLVNLWRGGLDSRGADGDTSVVWSRLWIGVAARP